MSIPGINYARGGEEEVWGRKGGVGKLNLKTAPNDKMEYYKLLEQV